MMRIRTQDFLLIPVLAVLACEGSGPAARQLATAETLPVSVPQGSPLADTTFVRLSQTLSEPGGFFDTDNLISNEASYLHVMGALQRRGVQGGAYIGVGPDQNFSYIARIRPRIAFIIDIRRDNLLEQLLFKAIFTRAHNRMEYLCLLLGKPVPQPIEAWTDRSIEEIVATLDTLPGTPATYAAAAQAAWRETRRIGLPLSATDSATLDRFHRTFHRAGLDLQFTSYGRGPRSYYPNLRQLILERDLEGRRSSYLAHEADFRFVRSLEVSNRIIPVVGDLAGEHALRAIGRTIAGMGLVVSALYTSNVEFYLMRDGSFTHFEASAVRLPRDARSVIIRSVFSGAYGLPPQFRVPGYYSAQLLQPLAAFATRAGEGGGYTSYLALVTDHAIDLRSR